MSVDNMTEEECSATFVVRVSKKPGEPWTGNVAWVTERCQQNFGSMQELFQLMNSTLTREENRMEADYDGRKK